MITVVGIDPGVTGAVAFVTHQGSATVLDLPTLPTTGKGMVKRKLDGGQLYDLIRSHIDPKDSVMVVIEDVHVVPGVRNSPQSQGSLMHSKGVIEAVVAIGRYVTHLVSVQAWKRHAKLGKDKGQALALAREVFLGADLRLAKHHNRAEALLIARFGLAKFT